MNTTYTSLADFMRTPGLDMMQRAEIFSEFTADVKEQHHLQYKRVALDGSAPVRRIKDPYTGEVRDMIYLASNDYLNLTRHPKVIEAGKRALELYGAGAGSVPLLGGTLDIHMELEEKVARFKGCEASLIYTSGFGSNATTIQALLQEEDVAILDMLVHASVIDGCTNTNTKFFKHNDMNSLERVLSRVKDQYRTKLVVLDGVYSMDGDIAKLDQIVEIAHHFGAYVMVDEAHATGVIGEHGRGTPEHCHVEGKVDIVAGTFSKALGVVGGFIASNKNLINLLNYYSRGYMFSTAMTPQAAGSLIAALDVIENEPGLRATLWDNINYFHDNLVKLGFDLGNAETAIFPIVLGDDYKVREVCRYMHERNIYVNPVLYPAVPKRSTRVRMSLMSSLTKEHLDTALNVLDDADKKFGITGRHAQNCAHGS